MGIPSYFSQIIRKYPHIVSQTLPEPVKTLYIDSNSIIYDSICDGDTEEDICHKVVKYIKALTEYIYPLTTFIAFDGIAPFAKMKQQRNRRYKSVFIKNVLLTTNPELLIASGTPFMNKLMFHVHNAFDSSKNYIVSDSNEKGEGEHKIMEHLRNNVDTTKNIALYGLDADLFMLSIFHATLAKNIYVFRETPEYMIHIKSDKLFRTMTYVNTNILMTHILDEMETRDFCRIYDYVFMCFLLGNDFLPHCPALNIRTHGIQRLLDTYGKSIKNVSGRYLVNHVTKQIQWPNVAVFLGDLATNEKTFMCQEFRERCKYAKNLHHKTKEEELNNIPLKYMEKEYFVCPSEQFWEKRYYDTFFGASISSVDIAKNYCEGLEWVFEYYAGTCKSWMWKYEYNYMPLLEDIYVFSKSIDKELVVNTDKTVTTEEHLKYIMPFDKYEELGFVKPNASTEVLTFHWSYCRYFWECNVEVKIDIL